MVKGSSSFNHLDMSTASSGSRYWSCSAGCGHPGSVIAAAMLAEGSSHGWWLHTCHVRVPLPYSAVQLTPALPIQE